MSNPETTFLSSENHELIKVKFELAKLLFDTKTDAPVRRRRTLPDGSYEFYKITRPTGPIDYAQDDEFAVKIHETHPDAPLSPIYINLRNLPENILDSIAIALITLPEKKSLRPDYIADIPKAGTPIAQHYSRLSGIPLLPIFLKSETDSVRQIMPNPEARGTGRLRIIDDLVNHGKTKEEAITVSRSLGFSITDLTVLVDCEQGAINELKALGVTLRSFFTLRQLVNIGLQTGRIDDEKYEVIMDYLANQ